MLPKYEVELTGETNEMLTNITVTINYKLNEHNTPEDVIKGALAYYLSKFYDEPDLASAVSRIMPMATSYPLKNRISEWRKKKRLSLSSFAHQIGISKGTLSGIEKNEHQPSLDVFFRIYFLLGCPPLDQLFYRDIPR